jgi:hypothetical protein
VLFVAALAIIVFQVPGATQNTNVGGENSVNAGLTFTRGQSVVPIFGGWMQNPDGSFDMHFSYFNRNWQEELDIPIGPDNNIQPASPGPDAGQPTHFLPRNNRWIFSVRVPADWASKEVVWTLTSHGQANRAHGTLHPGYVIDEYSQQHEFAAESTHGRKKPALQVEGDTQRTVKVGQPTPLVAVAIDENPPPSRRRTPPGPLVVGPGAVGGDSVRGSVPGLRFAWLVYRGAAKNVKFDPRIPFKVWEDQRGGSPWAPGWQPPPIPPGNKWVHNVTFQQPGTYVLRALAHNGSLFAYENVTFTVTVAN